MGGPWQRHPARDIDRIAAVAALGIAFHFEVLSDAVHRPIAILLDLEDAFPRVRRSSLGPILRAFGFGSDLIRLGLIP